MTQCFPVAVPIIGAVNGLSEKSERVIISTDHRRCLFPVYRSANLILTCLLNNCLERGKSWKVMESHGKSNTWSWVSLQSCFLTTPQGDHSAPTGLEVSRVAQGRLHRLSL